MCTAVRHYLSSRMTTFYFQGGHDSWTHTAGSSVRGIHSNSLKFMQLQYAGMLRTLPNRSDLENGWYGMSLKWAGIVLGPQPFGLSLISGVTKRAGASPLDILKGNPKSRKRDQFFGKKKIAKIDNSAAAADKVKKR